MTHLLIHRLYNFALMLALGVSVAVAALLWRHSHFSAPQAAEILPASDRTAELPPLW
jgi:hypothetical protein